MTTQDEFLNSIISALDKAKIPYIFSGSVASSYHGQPRATNDADIVIAPTVQQLEILLQLLEGKYYVSLTAAMDALKHNSAFNIIDIEGGWKADLIICKNRPFSTEEFRRRSNAELYGTNVWILSAEDIILSKLEWAKQSESERQFQDALGVAIAQWRHLDLGYLKKWAKELGIENSLKVLLTKANKMADRG
jgi:hypothetical protein